PMAQFHQQLIEHKVLEAIRLLRALGATRLEVEHVEGWAYKIGIRGSTMLPKMPQVELGAGAGASRDVAKRILYRKTFSSAKKPSLPDGLVWYWREPLWQNIAQERLQDNLQSFSLDVAYTDDFGINAALMGKLDALIPLVKLDLGGNFEDHQHTIYRISGEF